MIHQQIFKFEDLSEDDVNISILEISVKIKERITRKAIGSCQLNLKEFNLTNGHPRWFTGLIESTHHETVSNHL